MVTKANTEIRERIEKTGLFYWQVAERIGRTSGTFSVWMRTPLTPERKRIVEKAIKELEEGDATK